MVLLVALVMWAYLGWECKLGLLLSCWWGQSPPEHLPLSSFAQNAEVKVEDSTALWERLSDADELLR